MKWYLLMFGVCMLMISGCSYNDESVFFIGKNPFNQNLNTNDNVTFNSVTTTDYGVINGNLYIGGDIVTVDGINATGNVSPAISNTYSLGSTNNSWKDITISYQNCLYSTYSVAGFRSCIASIGTGDANTGAAGTSNVHKIGASLNGIQLGSSTGGFGCSNVAPQSCLIRTNNTNMIFFGGNSFIGLGTSTPSVELDIVKAKDGQSQVLLNNSNAGTSARGLISVRADSGTINLQQVSQAFTVVPAWTNSSILSFGGKDLWIHGTDGDNPNIIFALNGSAAAQEKMRIASNGRVGIGTSNPSATLHVIGNGIILNHSGSGLKVLGGSGSASLILGTSSKDWTLYPSGNDLRLYEYNTTFGGTGTDRVTFQANGNVGINTTSPSHKLSVIGGANVTGVMYMENPIAPSVKTGSPVVGSIYYNSTRQVLCVYNGTNWKLSHNATAC